MKKILVLGAGRSSSVLIQYLLKHAAEWNVMLTVADHSAEHAQAKIVQGSPDEKIQERGTAIAFDAHNELQRKEIISQHNIVVSMLPPHLHILIAKACIEFKKHLVTASYVTNEMQQLNDDVKKAGLLFMCEMGLDPGLDHMSAMKVIHEIQQQGHTITSFKSGTGGLVAPESDDNPWHYKVTWNPRNIVLAGQGTAQYLENGVKKFVPYHRLFTTTEKFKIISEMLPEGKFESYPNRDSLQYISKYNLEGVRTIIRSTLRKEGYCEAWNVLVQLGLTDDSYTIENLNSLTYSQWLSSYLPEKRKYHDKSAKTRTAKFLHYEKKDDIIQRLEWLGLFSDEVIGQREEHSQTPAQILQKLIEQKWMMQPQDNDLVVMRHELEFNDVTGENSNGKTQKQISTLVLKGEDAVSTAMAKTVGLPLGIMIKLLLTHELFLTGVQIPVMSQVYEPVLNELEELGIVFHHQFFPSVVETS